MDLSTLSLKKTSRNNSKSAVFTKEGCTFVYTIKQIVLTNEEIVGIIIFRVQNEGSVKMHVSSDKYERAHKEHINKYKMAHMIGVAEYMRERAEDYGLDPDICYTVGLLHDIGYLCGRNGHEAKGREILESLGVTDENTLQAVQRHGMRPEYVRNIYNENISPLLVLTYEADLSVDARGFRVGFDKRLEDIDTRYKGMSCYEEAINTATETVEFVKQWQKENGVDRPPKGFFHRHGRERE